jgi:hypothetical protein
MSDTKKYTKDLIGSNMGGLRMPQPPQPMPDTRQGPVLVKKRNEPGTIKPEIDLYEDEYKTEIGPKVNITTKKGIDITGGANITKYKDSEYKEPSETYFDISKEGDNYSYGITGSKKGKQKQITIGGKIRYSRGGGVSIQGTKFNGVK